MKDLHTENYKTLKKLEQKLEGDLSCTNIVRMAILPGMMDRFNGIIKITVAFLP
jgi:hypothetical protein